MKKYLPIVLSGGGSKGPYGAGVLTLLAKYLQEKEPHTIPCYFGTSVGALNATMAAQGDIGKLSELYASISTNDILNQKNAEISKLRLFWKGKQSPFSYFDNSALEKTIIKHASFEKLQTVDGHVTISVMNFNSGELETFYYSTLIDRFIEEDRTKALEKQRFRQYRKIGCQSDLVKALLASAAIPFFFPQVPIKHADESVSHYVDGGVGDNTPTRQAAFFCRFLNALNLGKAERVICVVNDPEKFSINPTARDLEIFGVINRTIELYHNEIIKDLLITWDRVNEEVDLLSKKEGEVREILNDISNIPADEKDLIFYKISAILRRSTAGTSRVSLPLIKIRPSSRLVENSLEFNKIKAVELQKIGYADAAQALNFKEAMEPSLNPQEKNT